jgi:hypothetical protein
MTLWIARYGLRMLAILMVMLLVEFASFFFALESGINRIYWVPVSFALVAYGGYDTVRRMPLVWGVVVGAVLAGTTSMLSLAIGTLLLEGKFRMPTEVDPLLLFTTLLMTSLIGAIVGGAAGVLARARRRDRARRTAIRKLSYMATDDVGDAIGDPPADIDEPAPALDPSFPRTAESR